MTLEQVQRGAWPAAVPMPQTPSDWLLARYDRVVRRGFGPQGDERRIRYHRGSNFDRRIFDVIDDHPGELCNNDDHGECFGWSGEASWPVAVRADELDVEAAYASFASFADTA